MHIKKGDTVKVITGKDKSKTGEVLKVLPQKYRAIVGGINMVTRHIKPTQQNPKGRREKKEASVHISNLMFVDPATQKATRIGRKKNDQGVLQRYSKKTKQLV